MLALLEKSDRSFIIPANCPDIIKNIITPTIKEMYNVNSGLYCLSIIIIISPIKPNSYYFYNIHI